MTLSQLARYQALTLRRDANAIHWWQSYRHPRGSLASASKLPLAHFPLCLGGRMPREICWHYKHQAWTLPLYQRTLARLRPHVTHDWLYNALVCIHNGEGAWTANTGNGYHGGLQMDSAFQSRWGADFVARYGGAENWPPWAQIMVGERAYHGLGSFGSWPNTARACGLR